MSLLSDPRTASEDSYTEHHDGSSDYESDSLRSDSGASARISHLHRILTAYPAYTLHRMSDVLDPFLPFDKGSARRKHFIWAALIFIACAIVATVMLVGRSMAQASLDDADIVIVSSVITAITDTTITNDLKVRITSNSPAAAWLEPSTAYMGLGDDSTFAHVSIPRSDVKPHAAVEHSYKDQVVTVTDQLYFDGFSIPLMMTELSTVLLSASVTAHPTVSMSRPFPLSLHKFVEIEGFNNFNVTKVWKITVESVNMLVPSGTFLLLGDMYNPTPVGFTDLKQLEFDAYYGDVKIGTSTTTNATLPLTSGWNTYEFRCVIRDKLGEDAGAVTDMMKKWFLQGKALPMRLVGRPDTTQFKLFQSSMGALDFGLVIPHIPIGGLLVDDTLPHGGSVSFIEGSRLVEGGGDSSMVLVGR